jgi:acetyl-CoA C-acetyltransferase
MKKVVITNVKRTPIGRFMGVFTNTTAVELGIHVTKAILKEANLNPELVDLFIFGHARQAGNRPNSARQIAYFSGIPYKTPAYTVNKVCSSSLLTIVHAYQAIVLGDAEIVIAGGTENMTRTPFILDRMRTGYRLGNFSVIDGMYWDGLLCPLTNMLMGQTAEKLMETYKIPRQEQDEFALKSYQKCETAIKEGKFRAEIIPIEIKDKKGTQVIDQDEYPRMGVTLDKLSKLQPIFKKDGTITPGNACGICDAAAVTLVMSEEKAQKLGLEPLAWVGPYAFAGVDPSIMGIGPVDATRKFMQKTGLKLDDFDLIEINEAFAAQVLACHKELNFPMDRVNVNGGAIALGHPIAATGARIVATLLHEMKRRNAKKGLVTLCESGGMGTTLSFFKE